MEKEHAHEKYGHPFNLLESVTQKAKQKNQSENINTEFIRKIEKRETKVKRETYQEENERVLPVIVERSSLANHIYTHKLLLVILYKEIWLCKCW